jgi:predicted DNA-binding protein
MPKTCLTPIAVRFSAEVTTRVDAIAKSMAISHSAVLRLAVNQWFEAGRDESGPFSLANKISKKVPPPKGRNSKAAL